MHVLFKRAWNQGEDLMHIDGIEILSDKDVTKALRQIFWEAACNLRLSKEAVKKYNETIENDLELVKQGRKPHAIVATRIYFNSLLLNETRTQVKIALTVGANVQAVRDLYRAMNNKEIKSCSKKTAKKMDLKFDIKCDKETPQAFYFLAKEKYKVRIVRETREGSCDCMGDTFKQGGREQKECKHIQKAREILKAIGK